MAAMDSTAEDEKAVREAWEHVIVCDGSYRHYAKGTVLLNWANHCFHEFSDFAAARAFTDGRKRQIAEIEEEIGYAEIVIKHGDDTCGEEGCGCTEPFKRILDSRIAARDELTKGMRRTQ